MYPPVTSVQLRKMPGSGPCNLRGLRAPGLSPVSGSTLGWKDGGQGFLHVEKLSWPGGRQVSLRERNQQKEKLNAHVSKTC